MARVKSIVQGSFPIIRLVSSNYAHADLVAYWRFEDETNPAEDISGNGQFLSGEAGRSTDVPVNPVPLTGAANTRSASFDGDQELTRDDSLLDFDFADAFTIEGWLMPASETSAMTRFILEKRQESGFTTNHGYAVALSTVGKLIFVGPTDEDVPAGSEWFDLVSTTTLPDDEWTHFAGVYYGNGLAELFINGIKEADNSADPLTVSSGTFANSDSFLVGQSRFPDVLQYEGLLDELRISDTALMPFQFLSTVPEPSRPRWS